MPKVTKTKKKVKKTKSKEVKKTTKKTAKVVTKTKLAVKAPIKISKTYVPKDTEKYMCDKHKVFFKIKLQEWRKELVRANNEALYNGSMDDNSISADIVDQASSYTDKKDQHPSRLSGGQQQRVAIARALAMRPKVMLLDEITSALDPEVVGEVLNVIRSLNKEHSLTMIMVTHQMGFAREISDRVCFFNEGKIFEQGPPEQLFGNPQNERTKQFLHAVLDANWLSKCQKYTN